MLQMVVKRPEELFWAIPAYSEILNVTILPCLHRWMDLIIPERQEEGILGKKELAE